MTRTHRALTGLLTAAVLALPVAGALAAAPKKPAPKPAPKKPAPAKPDPKLGKEAFKKEGCTGCHKTKDFPDGGTSGPDLSASGNEPAAKTSAYIAKPKAGSIMPPTKNPKTVADLTAYLGTQK
jgi:hypothetical protein